MQEYTQTVRGFLGFKNMIRATQEALQASDKRVSAAYQLERNSSASMRREEVMKAIREEERKKREQQRTEPMDIADMYTMMLPAIPKTEDALEDTSEEELDVTEKAARIQPQVDNQTKPPDVLCFEIRDMLPTLKLVEEAVNLCVKETGKYPYAIVLSNLRYIAMDSAMKVTQGFYITKDITRIPYRQADGTADYDVMAVCEA